MSKRFYNYEVMFLIGQAQSGDLAGVLTHIEEVINRAQGEVIAMKKWDERRLAFEIGGQKRGLYILAYVKMPGASLANFERDCNLSEKIMRTMTLRADHLTVDEMKAADDRQGLATEAKLRAEKKDLPEAAAPAPAAAEPVEQA